MALTNNKTQISARVNRAAWSFLMMNGINRSSVLDRLLTSYVRLLQRNSDAMKATLEEVDPWQVILEYAK